MNYLKKILAFPITWFIQENTIMDEPKYPTILKGNFIHLSYTMVWLLIFVCISCSPLYYFIFQTQNPEKDSMDLTPLLLPLITLQLSAQSIQSVTYPWGTFTDNQDGTIRFLGTAGTFGGQLYSETTLTYAKCSIGQTWIREGNSCSPEIPSTGLYCPTNNNDCNDIGTSLLNNPLSTAYAYCDSLELGGRSNWRVATKNELKLTIACSDNPTDIPIDNNVAGCGSIKRYFLNTNIFQLTGTGSIGSYWTATSQSSGIALYVDYTTGRTTGAGKAIARQVRCVSEP
ncbi:MAG: DUF1566 domain-containing protein [Leptospiraceae bacterium]|nr:DUF1566 domain-containing protein [Leptospiraceae bacterium]MCZ8347207.1 DUF1566 domain-containing protein [Leptospiraceae bacterium]